MRSRNALSVFRWVALALIFLAIAFTGYQLVRYSRLRSSFAPGMRIAGVPVGGLTQGAAAERLVQAYGVPVELHYGDAVIQVKPQVLGFELDLELMLAAADLQRIDQPFWSAFWNYLWNQMPSPQPVPLSASIAEDRLRSYLSSEIASRYDQPPSVSVPIAGSVDFQPGIPGTSLDIDRAVTLIDDALRSPNARVVNLTFNRVSPERPSFQNLEVLLKQTLDLSGFDGLTEIYLLDLQTEQEINFAYQLGTEITPGVAFTAASTIKIPIVVSTFRRFDEPTPDYITDMVKLMIERSENDPADRLMEQVMGGNLGPLELTDDLQALGLENTFLAGYFYPGAPLLVRISTPANERADISTNPDVYNQTTPAEMGTLLNDIYQCSENGGGSFAAVWPGEISKTECQKMIDYLVLNDIPMLIRAGLPEGTRIGHKHGWIQESDGLLHSVADAAIVYTPGGNYILTIFMYQSRQLVFDPANQLVADLSRAIYNYYNIPD